MQTVEQALAHLQNLTNAKITQEEFGKALGTGRANISKRIKNGSYLTLDEIRKLEKYFKAEYFELQSFNTDEIEKYNSMMQGDRIEIKYWNELPEELKNPKIASVWFDKEIVENAWGMNADHLCIVPMVGDKMAHFWYPIRNGDMLIVDTSQNYIMGNGVYFATSRNNTRYWIREMQNLINDDVQIKGYAPSGDTTKVFSNEELLNVNFKLIGKVIKNVSFRL